MPDAAAAMPHAEAIAAAAARVDGSLPPSCRTMGDSDTEEDEGGDDVARSWWRVRWPFPPFWEDACSYSRYGSASALVSTSSTSSGGGGRTSGAALSRLLAPPPPEAGR